MAQAVSTEMFVAEVSHDVVPVGRVAEDCGADAAAPRSGEEAGVWLTAKYFDAALDEVAEFEDEWDVTGALALGAFVGEAAGGRRGLSANLSLIHI